MKWKECGQVRFTDTLHASEIFAHHDIVDQSIIGEGQMYKTSMQNSRLLPTFQVFANNICSASESIGMLVGYHGRKVKYHNKNISYNPTFFSNVSPIMTKSDIRVTRISNLLVAQHNVLLGYCPIVIISIKLIRLPIRYSESMKKWLNVWLNVPNLWNAKTSPKCFHELCITFALKHFHFAVPNYPNCD